MKTNRKKLLAISTCLLATSLMVTSCGKKKNPSSSSVTTTSSQEHVHNPSSSWSYDKSYHYHTCECSEQLDKSLHTFEDGKCTICGYENNVFSQGFQFDLKNDNTYAIVDIGSCFDEVISIPSIYNGLKVTSIEDNALSYNDNVKRIIIPDSVTHIGNNAFADNAQLESVTLGKNVEYIGYGAFAFCPSLTSIEFPSSTKIIQEQAFYSCTGLKNITCSDDIECISGGFTNFDEAENLVYNVYENGKYLGSKDNKYFALIGVIDKSQSSFKVHDDTKFIMDYAFYKCNSLENISLPSSLVQIQDQAFSGCSSLKYNEYENGLYLGNETNKYLAFKGMKNPNATSITIHEDTNFILSDAFYNNLTVEEIQLGDKVKQVGEAAFYRCEKLTKFTLPDSVRYIGVRAFYKCYLLPSITFSDNLIYIGGSAFYECKKLTKVELPSSLIEINSYAFQYCSSLESLTLGENTIYIDYCAFSNTAIKNLVIPDSVRYIESNAFYRCPSIESVHFGKGIRDIGSEVFNVDLPIVKQYENGYYIGNNDNPYQILLQVDYDIEGNMSIHQDTEIISGGIFYLANKITKLVLPENVKYLSSGSLNSLSIQSITLNKNLKCINPYAFGTCYRLLEVYNLSSIYIGEASNTGASEYALDIYTSSSAASKIQEPDENGYQFYIKDDDIYLTGYFKDQTKITLPDSYQGKKYKINKYAFARSKVTDVTISNGVTELGYESFYNAPKLEKVIISDSVQKVESRSFTSCSSLKQVIIGSQATLDPSVFSYCFNLEFVVIRNKNISIDTHCFYGCNKLSKVYYYGDEASWNNCSISDEESNEKLLNATKYFYSENEPSLNEEGTEYDGNYWHYGEDLTTPIEWVK